MPTTARLATTIAARAAAAHQTIAEYLADEAMRISAIRLGRATEDALALPRHHPMRFALLYGCGRDYFRRAALAMQYDAGASRVRDIVADAPATVKLETDILLFERWQSQEAGRIRRENAQIHYAAAEKGLFAGQRRPLEQESDIERDRR